MRKTVFVMLAMALVPFCAFAVDGVVLINQSTLNAAGGTYPITQTGSYKLSGNLQVKDANTTPIVVTANNVTIDLNGFTIGGTNVCSFQSAPLRITCSFTSAQNGIDGGSSNNLTVTNGTINGMGQYGINGAEGTRIDSVTVTNNGSGGMFLLAGLVDKCRVHFNGGYGISAIGSGGSVQNSFIDTSALFGLRLGNQWGYSRIICRTIISTPAAHRK